jgi:hypothetical protein
VDRKQRRKQRKQVARAMRIPEPFPGTHIAPRTRSLIRDTAFMSLYEEVMTRARDASYNDRDTEEPGANPPLLP